LSQPAAFGPTLTLPYGHASRQLRLPPGVEPAFVRSTPAPAASPPREVLRAALDAPVASAPLRQLARGRGSASVLVPGKTRVAALEHVVPLLLDELEAAGVPARATEVVLATGTHEHHLESDIVRLLGERTARRVRCRAHACREGDTLSKLGVTSRGTPVWLDAGVLASEVVVATGRIVPHYFAGFSGGRKALVPGVAGWDTIVANHRLTLGGHSGIDPGCRPGRLADNPVHLDMCEAASMAPPDFVVNTVQDERGRVVAAVAGHWERAFERGCAVAGEQLCAVLDEPIDLLVTSAGGNPHDGNFMQSIKAVLNLEDAIAPGGAVLWLAEAAGDLHPGFRTWLAIGDDAELDRRVRADYDLTGHNSILLRRLQRRADVHLHSALDDDVVRELGFTPAPDPQRTFDALAARLPANARLAVVHAANVIAARAPTR